MEVPVKKFEADDVCRTAAGGRYRGRGGERRAKKLALALVAAPAAAVPVTASRRCRGPPPRTAGATHACTRPPPRVSRPPGCPPVPATSSCLRASTPPLPSQILSVALVLCTPRRSLHNKQVM